MSVMYLETLCLVCCADLYPVLYKHKCFPCSRRKVVTLFVSMIWNLVIDYLEPAHLFTVRNFSAS